MLRKLALAALLATMASCNTAPEPQATDEPSPSGSAEPRALKIEEFEVPEGSHPHDVAPARDGTIWYTAQQSGRLGRLDPEDGSTEEIELGEGSAPHGVIVGPDGSPYITDSGLNAIVRVDRETEDIRIYALPEDQSNDNLNTATFDKTGTLWFTGQRGVYGSVDPVAGRVRVYDAPGGRGPYGITTTPEGDVYYASLAGSHIAHIDTDTGKATRIYPPTESQGARRVWSDSKGNIWVSEYEAGKLAMYDPEAELWEEWVIKGRAQPYAVFVDDRDIVWLSDFGANALVRFDPETESFDEIELPASPGNVRQIHGRRGEVWGAESAADALIRVRTR